MLYDKRNNIININHTLKCFNYIHYLLIKNQVSSKYTRAQRTYKILNVYFLTLKIYNISESIIEQIFKY